MESQKNTGNAEQCEILKDYPDSRLSLDLEIDEKITDESKDEEAEYVLSLDLEIDEKITDESKDEEAEYAPKWLLNEDNKRVKLADLQDAFDLAVNKLNRVNSPYPDGTPLYKAQKNIIDQGLPKRTVNKKIIIVGAGVSGLCAGYELRRAGYEVSILEASHRVGGRVETWRHPFTHPLHTEAGAMRILPQRQEIIRSYLKHFNMCEQLEEFESNNKCIYLCKYGKLLEYSDFQQKLIERDEKLLSCFPGLLESEKGKSLDTLWREAIEEINKTWTDKYYEKIKNNKFNESVAAAWRAVTRKYDKYSVKTYLQHKNWSDACIEMYRLGTNQVGLTISILEEWKDAFLIVKSKNSSFKQLKNGMDTFPRAFLEQHDANVTNDLKRHITFGAKVTKVHMRSESHGSKIKIIATYESPSFCEHKVEGDFVVFAVPYNIQRLIRTTPVFSPSKREAIQNVRYIESTIVLLQFKTRWWHNLKSHLAVGGGIVTDLPSRYAVLPSSKSAQFKNTNRGIIRASYTQETDAMIMAEGRVKQTLKDFTLMFGEVVMEKFEVGAVNAFSENLFTGNSALCCFGPQQKTQYYKTMVAPEWVVKDIPRAFFAGEQASVCHGWIQGAIEAGLRAAQNISNVCIAWK